jgi:hypothetical protein
MAQSSAKILLINKVSFTESAPFRRNYWLFLSAMGLNTRSGISGTNENVTPFQGSETGNARQPRALPWAGIYRPFRAGKRPARLLLAIVKAFPRRLCVSHWKRGSCTCARSAGGNENGWLKS